MGLFWEVGVPCLGPTLQMAPHYQKDPMEFSVLTFTLKELIKKPTMKFSGSFLVFSETPIASLKDHT
jgi:hypothetical protein